MAEKSDEIDSPDGPVEFDSGFYRSSIELNKCNLNTTVRLLTHLSESTFPQPKE